MRINLHPGGMPAIRLSTGKSGRILWVNLWIGHTIHHWHYSTLTKHAGYWKSPK